MPAWLSSPISLLFGSAIAGGVLAFWATRRFGRVAGLVVFGLVGVATFVVVRPLYARASHCDGVFVPGWIAFTVACGTWAGIYCGGAPPGEYGTWRVALLAGVLPVIPGVALLLMLWPCQ